MLAPDTSRIKGEPTFSLEFFPPKDEAGEARLWSAMSELHELRPDFVSVTYGAGGSTRDRTARITSEITERTGLPTIAHLTCVGSTREEIITVLRQYKDAGITTVLALRGDPKEGPRAPWIDNPTGINHADELVSLAREEGFSVGVAAFPDGHPSSRGNFEQDIDVLIEKERRGASFATTQFFFSADRYFTLVDSLRKRGSHLPIYAGILPITNVKQLHRSAELQGTPIPHHIQTLFDGIDDPIEIRRRGIDVAIKLCEELLHRGVPGLHFFTMNSAHSTREIVSRIGLR